MPKPWPGAKLDANPLKPSLDALEQFGTKVDMVPESLDITPGLPPKLPAVGGNSLNPAPKDLPADCDAKFNTWLSSDTMQAELNLEKIFGVDSQSAKQLVNDWLKTETPMKALLKKHFGVKSVPPTAKIEPLANP